MSYGQLFTRNYQLMYSIDHEFDRSRQQSIGKQKVHWIRNRQLRINRKVINRKTGNSLLILLYLTTNMSNRP